MSSAPTASPILHESLPKIHPPKSARPPVPIITGFGMITPLGLDAAATWSRLLRGDFIRETGRAPMRRVPGRPRVLQLALAAASEAMSAEARASSRGDDADELALVVGTSKGCVDEWLSPPPHMSDATCVAGGTDLSGLGRIAEFLCKELHIAGPRLTVSAACASGLQALIRACMMLRRREARRILVVAAESSLHPLFLENFRRLGVLAPPDFGCRPFDVERRGFLVSEAAAAVVVEAIDSDELANPGSWSYGIGQPGSVQSNPVVVEAFALGGDATHLTGCDPDGRALEHLVGSVLAGRPMDLVHAHGTGTAINDQTELSVFERTLGDDLNPPALYSCKAALGHSLGAAGLISVVINCMAHANRSVPPNVQTRRPMPSRRLSIRADVDERTVRRSVVTAAGFGGSMAAISLKST